MAFECSDPDECCKELTGRGAVFIEKCPNTIAGDYLLVLHDPWGNCIQLVKRKPGRLKNV